MCEVTVELWNFRVADAMATIGPVQTLASSIDASAPAPGLPLVFSRVFGQSIPSRYELGPLGRGWTHNWDIRIQELSNGDVFVQGPSGLDRSFTKNLDGSFSALPGDYGRLEVSGGVYRLREADQTTWQFRADKTLDFVSDTNGNTITLGYNGGLLTSLTHSNGKQFLLDYYPNGRIWHVVDPLGPGSADDRITTYEYDSAGEHLTTATAPGDRTTRYTYYAGPKITNFHALLTVQYPDLNEDHFFYDDRGRLTQTARQACGCSDSVTYTYGGLGIVTVTDAANRSTVLKYGLGGQLAQIIDGKGNVVNLGYDDKYQLTQLTGPSGEQYHYSYDSRGNLTGIGDPMRYSTAFGYEPAFNQLTDVDRPAR